ncbi:MAG: hypothetical protein ACRD5Z_04420, partial [Bryobacteraceae bacterium]
MRNVRDGKQEWVVKNGTAKVERDTMFAYVRGGFEIVPFELKLAIMQSPLSRIIGSKDAHLELRRSFWFPSNKQRHCLLKRSLLRAARHPIVYGRPRLV